MPSLSERFWSKAEPEPNSGCWLWTASVRPGGYGQCFNGASRTSGVRRSESAHRVAWILDQGEIPPGLYVCHRCDNRLCVNPAHLFLGTIQDNLRDMRDKGRHAKGERAGRATLTDAQVADVRRLAAAGHTYASLSAEFSVGRTVIRDVCRGKTWSHVHTEHIQLGPRHKGLPKGTAPWWKPWERRVS